MIPLPVWVAAPKHPVSHWDRAVTQKLGMRIIIGLIPCCATRVEEIVKAAWGLGMSPFCVPSSPCPPQSLEDREGGSKSSFPVNYASMLSEGLQGQLAAIARLAGNSQELAVGMSDDVRRRDSLMYTEIEVTRPAEELKREKMLLTHRKKKNGVCGVFYSI